MQETQEMWIRSLGGEDTLEEEMATHSSILDWKIPWGGPHGLKESDTTDTNLARTHRIKTKQ